MQGWPYFYLTCPYLIESTIVFPGGSPPSEMAAQRTFNQEGPASEVRKNHSVAFAYDKDVSYSLVSMAQIMNLIIDLSAVILMT